MSARALDLFLALYNVRLIKWILLNQLLERLFALAPRYETLRLSIFQFAADSSDWMFLLQFFVSPNIDGEASFELDELDSNSNHPELKFI